ncbi:hypothetical protein J7K18_04800 [bacterium]|nr:hypothetical protein [bacterium]
MRAATVDIGSNSFILLIVDSDITGVRKIHEEFRTVALASGKISQKKIEIAKETIADFMDTCKRHNVERLFPFGTEAIRNLSNNKEFIQLLEETLGKQLNIISGKEEAKLSFIGATYNKNIKGTETVMTIDVGGGSTEIAYGVGKTVKECFSFPVGAWKVKQEGGSILDEYLPAVAKNKEKIEHLFAVGGNIASAAGVFLGLDEYIEEMIDGTRMYLADIEQIEKRFLALPRDRLEKLLPFARERIDVLPFGLAIYRKILEAVSCSPEPYCTVSTRGVRWGYLLKMLGAIQGG